MVFTHQLFVCCQKCYLYHNKILTVNSGVWWFGMVLVVQSWLVWFLFLQPCFPPPTFTLGSFVLLVLSLVAVKETQSLSWFCVWKYVGRRADISYGQHEHLRLKRGFAVLTTINYCTAVILNSYSENRSVFISCFIVDEAGAVFINRLPQLRGCKQI